MDNLRGILWMIAAMAGFALEDAFIKLASGTLARSAPSSRSSASAASCFSRASPAPAANPS